MVECDPGIPLTVHELRQAIGDCLNTGSLVFTTHSLARMESRNIIETDVVNVLLHGQIQPDPEPLNWHWRYTINTQNYGVVVTFEPDEGEIKELIVITAFRHRRRQP